MRTVAFALAALALGSAAGCGGTDDLVEPGTEPGLARLVCAQNGARVLTPRVEARPDGVHVEVTNETARVGVVVPTGGPASGPDAVAPPGTSRHVLAIGPGSWTVTCYETGGAHRTAAFEVVDTGIWVSTELTGCEPESVHGDTLERIRAGEAELAEKARRAIDGAAVVEPGYGVERAGYPEQETAVFRARDDGETVAAVDFYPVASGEWIEGDVTYCADPPSGGEPYEGPAPDPST